MRNRPYLVRGGIAGGGDFRQHCLCVSTRATTTRWRRSCERRRQGRSLSARIRACRIAKASADAKLTVTPIEIYNLVLYQIGALSRAFARTAGTVVGHVKPHGALYHMWRRRILTWLRRSCRRFATALPGATVVGQSGGALVAKAVQMKLAGQPTKSSPTVRIDPTDSLQPRDRPNAVITDPMRAAERITGLLQTGAIEAIDGSMLTMPADTVCVHGDTPRAPEFARILAEALVDSGVVLKISRQMSGVFRVISNSVCLPPRKA